ncbi:MAG: hypothetical protein H6709_13820 [Kofleriaceae bacterium]|nr:hypothetical protein [Myxococcales bacterium]MCB9561989.1 hypothetical protein [Kofleriaceae bacterium]MCB9573157.1 hypothetical protein [Kofleriaceae bacterium]
MTTSTSTSTSRPTPVHPDAKRSRLRGLIAKFDQELTGTEPAPMVAAWQNLVAALDLGPEPEVKTCPTCGAIGLRNASRCGHCWAHLG